MTLRELKIGHRAIVTVVGGEGALRQHFLDMGIIPGIEVTLIRYAPMGDPMQIMLHGYLLTLRLDDAAQIEISTDIPVVPPKPPLRDDEIPHPGLGEEGRYHEEDQLRRKEIRTREAERHGHNHSSDHDAGKKTSQRENLLTFALAGNQNSGKTTLFNQLTGSNQHVGNFPGVTVDRKTGVIRGYPQTEITDLPGIYSLSPYTAEEIVSRRFILDEHPSAIFNIVDATNIERNLYLTMQLIELNTPMVLALNMMDEMRGNGGSIRVNEMEATLGIPVIPISAAKNEGIDELISHAVHVAQHHEIPYRQDFCAPQDHDGTVHRCLHAVMHLIERHAERAGIPVRFAATKLIEGDPMTIEALQLTESESHAIEHIVEEMEQKRGLDRAAAIADMRFSFIKDLCDKTVVKPRRSREQVRTNAIDRVLMGRWTALPSFLLIIGFIFFFTFFSLGGWIQEEFSVFLDWCGSGLSDLLTRLEVNHIVRSLVVDGVYAGISTVLSFMPVIVILFFWLSMLEDSGYLARVAFVSDKLLRKVGLSGRSIVPMLIGFGCSVPAVMSTRTLPSARDRRLTILLTPYMSCTAKYAIYGWFCIRFFPSNGSWIIISLYVLGVLTGILVAVILGRFVFKGEPVPFVMELPNYRMPGARNTLRLMWDKAKDFIQRAFTVIFLAAIVIWFLRNFNWHLSMVDESQSMLADIAGAIAPVFAPLGLGDWRWVTALVSGFMAKESVVGTIGVLFPGDVGLHEIMSPALAFVFLVFSLLYTPCVAAIAAIRRELGGRSALIVVILQCSIAWLIAWFFHQLLF
ncbi:MAG: ferrous iron transport protein B [Bacteroidales bacterium]|nr:ferrous iron transport protein B [Bacteroidales bacterium]